MSGEDEHVDTQLSPLWQCVHPRYGIDDDDDDDDDADVDEAAKATRRQRDADERAALAGRARPPDYVKLNKRAPRVGQLLRYLNDVEDDEELQQLVLEKDPVTGQTLLQWATLQGHYLLVEYLVKRLRRAAFAFDLESPDMAVYTRWEEMRPELPAAADVLERQRQREVRKAARAAARQQRRREAAGGNDDGLDDNDDEDDDAMGDDEDDYDDGDEDGGEGEAMPEELVYDALEEYHEQWGASGLGLVRRIGELGVYVGPRRRDGTKQGIGQSLYVNGDCYAGGYVDNKREGRGTYWWSRASVVYCGEWHHNLRHGYGHIAYADGSRYLGHWHSNRKHGSGRYTYADGSSYDGAWVHDEKHGSGTYTFTDGSVYRGSFVHNAFVAGEWRLACGTVRYIGSFDTEKIATQGGSSGSSGSGKPTVVAARRALTRDVPTGAGVFMHRCGGGGDGGQQRYMQEGVYDKGRWQPGVLRGTVSGAAQVHALVTPPPPAAAAAGTAVTAPQRPVRVPLVYQTSASAAAAALYTATTTTTTTTQQQQQQQQRLCVDDLVHVASFGPLLQWLRVVLFAPAVASAVRVERLDVLRVRYDAADAHRLVRVWLRPLLLDVRGKRVRRLDLSAVAAAAASAATVVGAVQDEGNGIEGAGDDNAAAADMATLCVHDDTHAAAATAVAVMYDADADANDVNDDVLVFAAPTTRLLVVLDEQAGEAHDTQTLHAPVVLLQQQQQHNNNGSGSGGAAVAAALSYTLPVVSVSSDGVMHGDVAERVARALRLQLTHTRHTLVLMQPALYTTAQSSMGDGDGDGVAAQQVLVYMQQLHRDALATLHDKLHHLPPYTSPSPHDDSTDASSTAAIAYTALPIADVARVPCDAVTAAALTRLQRCLAERRLPHCTAPPQRPPTPLPPPPQPRPDLQPLYTAKAARDEANDDE